MYRVLFIICFMGMSTWGSAQNSQSESVVKPMSRIFLKGGTQMDVTIISWDMRNGITALSSWGQEIFISESKISKVKDIVNNQLQRSVYIPPSNGIYYSLSGGLIAGNNGGRLNDTKGYTFSVVSGYRFSRLLSVGLGTGVDSYAHSSGERINPIFVDLRSYLFPSNSTIVANLQAGYGLAFNNANKGITDAQGGWMIYPNIGVSFGATYIKYSFDIGYKFQEAHWTYSSQWDIKNRSEYNLNYKRLVIRFGVMM